MREVKIMTTLKELKSFCKKNKMKCVKDKKEKDKLWLTIPAYMDTVSKGVYKSNFKYEVEYFMDRFVITVYDQFYDDFNNLKAIYSWSNSQQQILGVLFLKNEYLLFMKSEKRKWDSENWYWFREFRGEQNDNSNN